jgi:hypothetical protein
LLLQKGRTWSFVAGNMVRCKVLPASTRPAPQRCNLAQVGLGFCFS